MSIFNSLGSNYDRHTIARILKPARTHENSELVAALRQEYKATNVQITYKCREAICLGLKQLEIPADSLVAINGFTCYAVYEAIISAGLKPYYIDVPEREFNFSPSSLERALKDNQNIKVVIVQNTFGIPADVVAIQKLCNKYKVQLVEDLAHAAGLQYKNGEKMGTIGAWAALSFSQDKMIDAVSGGALVDRREIGAAITSNPYLSLRQRFVARVYPASTVIIRSTIRFGLGRVLLKIMKAVRALPRPMSGGAGTVHALSPWHAREARLAIETLSATISHRKMIAAVYHKVLDESVQTEFDDTAGYLRFPILVNNREKLLSYLQKNHIYLSDIWYDAPIGPKKYQSLTDYNGQCPNAETLASTIVNLPTHTHVNERQAKIIAEKVNTWLKLA